MVSSRKIFFIGLNVVRAFSLIALILVFSSTIYVIVTNVKAVNVFDAQKNSSDSSMLDCDYIDGSTVPNQPAGPFWAVVASLLIIAQTVMLCLSECGWPAPFFDRFFPVLGTNFGLGPLGIFQGLISTQILSHHVDDFTLVSAFFLFVLGCINMLLGLIFRESAKTYRSFKIWKEDAKGILPSSFDSKRPMILTSSSVISNPFAHKEQSFAGPQVTVVRHDTSASDAPSWTSTSKVGYGFGRQGEKAAGLKGFLLQKPEESLPRYVANSPGPASNASLSRSVSSVSGTSSFYSRDVQRVANIPPMPQRFQYEDEDEQETGSRSNTPSFKSSKQVI